MSETTPSDTTPAGETPHAGTPHAGTPRNTTPSQALPGDPPGGRDPAGQAGTESPDAASPAASPARFMGGAFQAGLLDETPAASPSEPAETPATETPATEAHATEATGDGSEQLPSLELPPRPAVARRPAVRGPGALLRDARIGRGLSIPEVERDTRINRDYLEAIEAEQFERLPAPVYARGFVRSYARYVGIDADAAVAAIPSDLPRPAGLDPLPGLRGGEVGALPQVDPRWIAIGVGALVAAVAAFYLFTRVFGGDDGGGTLPAGVLDSPTPTEAPLGTGATGASGDGTDGATSDGAASDGTATDGAASDGTTTDDPGTAAPPAETVPPFEVGETPDFLGVSLEAASAVLDQLELTFLVIEAQNPSLAPGTVFAQTPEAGSEIDADAVVTLIVSRAEQTAAP